jgi:flagellar basal body-associated protein FliL
MNKTRKGYILIIVMVLSLVLSITAVSTFTVVMRYMFHAKENANDLQTACIEIYEEDYSNEWF